MRRYYFKRPNYQFKKNKIYIHRRRHKRIYFHGRKKKKINFPLILFIIFIFFIFILLIQSNQRLPFKTNETESYIQICKKNAENELERRRIQSFVDFRYTLILSGVFNSTKEAKNFANRYNSFSINICKNVRGEIIALIYEIRYSPSLKETTTIFCDENGSIIPASTIC
jgi:hypothetical protein